MRLDLGADKDAVLDLFRRRSKSAQRWGAGFLEGFHIEQTDS
jgi:hypothetical protein